MANYQQKFINEEMMVIEEVYQMIESDEEASAFVGNGLEIFYSNTELGIQTANNVRSLIGRSSKSVYWVRIHLDDDKHVVKVILSYFGDDKPDDDVIISK